MTGFRGRLRSQALLDLTAKPTLMSAKDLFCEPPYAATIALAERAQAQGAEVIRYDSLRCQQLQQRNGQTCYAALNAHAFEGNGLQAGSERNFAFQVHDQGVDVLATTGPERIALPIPPN